MAGHEQAEESLVEGSSGLKAALLACTCGKAGTAWGFCDRCEVDRWVVHHCPFPCDDVTCENGSVCLPCLTGAPPCPAHDDPEYGDD